MHSLLPILPTGLYGAMSLSGVFKADVLGAQDCASHWIKKNETKKPESSLNSDLGSRAAIDETQFKNLSIREQQVSCLWQQRPAENLFVQSDSILPMTVRKQAGIQLLGIVLFMTASIITAVAGKVYESALIEWLAKGLCGIGAATFLASYTGDPFIEHFFKKECFDSNDPDKFLDEKLDVDFDTKEFLNHEITKTALECFFSKKINFDVPSPFLGNGFLYILKEKPQLLSAFANFMVKKLAKTRLSIGHKVHILNGLSQLYMRHTVYPGLLVEQTKVHLQSKYPELRAAAARFHGVCLNKANEIQRQSYVDSLADNVNSIFYDVTRIRFFSKSVRQEIKNYKELVVNLWPDLTDSQRKKLLKSFHQFGMFRLGAELRALAEIIEGAHRDMATIDQAEVDQYIKDYLYSDSVSYKLNQLLGCDITNRYQWTGALEKVEDILSGNGDDGLLTSLLEEALDSSEETANQFAIWVLAELKQAASHTTTQRQTESGPALAKKTRAAILTRQ